MRPTVFVAVQLTDDLRRLLSERCVVDAHSGPYPIPREALLAGLSAANGVLANPLIPFPSEIINAGPHLRAIANIGVGYDNVDLQHGTKRGIAVANTPGVLSDLTAFPGPRRPSPRRR
jgi:lactate dehydrogenase-like 2-hydroxyacid dehydrogenase